MKKPDFVYVTYIASTPEKVFQALIEPGITRQYWVGLGAKVEYPAHENVSDWEPGSRWEHLRCDGSKVADVAGKVVENDPPRRLVMTWARPAEFADMARHSRVSFDIEQLTSGLVKLVVAHDELEGDPEMLTGISGGWPMVLSNLKTFLETGHSLRRA